MRQSEYNVISICHVCFTVVSNVHSSHCLITPLIHITELLTVRLWAGIAQSV